MGHLPQADQSPEPVTLLSSLPNGSRAFARDSTGQVWLLSDDAAKPVDDSVPLHHAWEFTPRHAPFESWAGLGEYLDSQG